METRAAFGSSLAMLALAGLLTAAGPASAQSSVFPTFSMSGGSSATYDTGMLTVTPTTGESTTHTFQPVQVKFWNRATFYAGQGVYHDFAEDPGSTEASSLVSFTVRSASGDVLVGNGRLFTSRDLTRIVGGALPPGQLTTYPIATPGNQAQWYVYPTGATVINTNPSLHSGWSTRTSLEAMGGSYAGTANTQDLPDSSAVWSGNVPVPGVYEISAWLPVSLPGSLPRTAHATYGTGVGALVAHPPVSQVMTASGWIVVGKAAFSGNYNVMLDDRTGEPAGTRSIVANAIRLRWVANQ
jgi:hypothetical protein